MNRRQLLEYGALTSGCLALGGAYIGRTAWRRNALARQLVSDALPTIMNQSHSELATIPGRARKRIRDWFHGKALLVKRFADAVASPAYLENLDALEEKDRQGKLLATFFGKVVTPAEIKSQLDDICSQIGACLDQDWHETANSIATEWGLQLKPMFPAFDGQQLTKQLDDHVCTRLTALITAAHATVATSTLSGTAREMGKAALMLFPWTDLEIKASLAKGEFHFQGNLPAIVLALPVFVLSAFSSAVRFVAGLLHDARADLQTLVSSQLSGLGNELSSKFESEVRNQLGKLHGIQEESLICVAAQYSQETIKWF